jgi:endonuclease YncB( thermonuclease family)
MRKLYSQILAAICWLTAAVPVRAAIIPDCAGEVEIGHATVIRIERNGALILSDGRAVLLEGIRLPLEHGGALADQALAQLRSLAMAGPLTLTATRPKEDRYDRVRVQAFGTGWLQMEMLKRGLARVQIAPDRNECAPDFYETEAVARTAHAGLWASPAYAVRAPETLRADIGTFQIAEGRISGVSRRDGRLFLNFGLGFAAMVGPDDVKKFRDLDPPVEEWTGQLVRLRGTVEDNKGRPEIELSNPAQIEILQ